MSVVQAMVSENPDISDQQVANNLMKDYGEQLENGRITWFAIRNVRKKLDKSNVLKSVDEKTTLDDVALKEFADIMKDGVAKAQEIYEKTKDAEDYGLALKGLEQIRKNMVSMMVFYQKHVIPPIQNLTINEDKKVIIVLQKYQGILCANCRERVNREILIGAESEQA